LGKKPIHAGGDLPNQTKPNHEATKSCFRRKQMGAEALWDVATETGEIATAVLAQPTKTKNLPHAAT